MRPFHRVVVNPNKQHFVVLCGKAVRGDNQTLAVSTCMTMTGTMT